MKLWNCRPGTISRALGRNNARRATVPTSPKRAADSENPVADLHAVRVTQLRRRHWSIHINLDHRQVCFPSLLRITLASSAGHPADHPAGAPESGLPSPPRAGWSAMCSPSPNRRSRPNPANARESSRRLLTAPRPTLPATHRSSKEMIKEVVHPAATTAAIVFVIGTSARPAAAAAS